MSRNGQIAEAVKADDAAGREPIDSLLTEVKKLTASDGAVRDSFGWSVAINRDTVVVGADDDDDKGINSGSAYIYERNKGGADNWGEVRKLTASDGAANDLFGFSVAISGDTVVVGARGNDDKGSNSGSAYIYERNKGGADNWGEVKKLTASDSAESGEFGSSVAICGDLIVIGAISDYSAKGSVYVFERNKGGADNWGQAKKLTASDGAANDFFGWSVAISGATIVAGAIGGSCSGSAYIYERNEGGADNWGEVKKLTASDGGAFVEFGRSVAINGDTVVVGADDDDDKGINSGSAYIYERNKGGADNWGEVRKLMASDGAANDSFGFSVAIIGATVVVGAIFDDSSKGSAYVFEQNKGGADNWGEVKKLTASDDAVYGYFGKSVVISGDTVVVGAPGSDASNGSAYVFAYQTNAPLTVPARPTSSPTRPMPSRRPAR